MRPYRLSYTVSKLWPIIGQIFAGDRGVLHFNDFAGGDLQPACEYPDKLIYLSRNYRMIFLPEVENHTIVSSFVWKKHWNVTDRRTDMRPGYTAVCIASNADRCKKLEAMSLTQLLAFSVSEFEVIAFQITGIDIETSLGICGFKKGIPGAARNQTSRPLARSLTLSWHDPGEFFYGENVLNYFGECQGALFGRIFSREVSKPA